MPLVEMNTPVRQFLVFGVGVCLFGASRSWGAGSLVLVAWSSRNRRARA